MAWKPKTIFGKILKGAVIAGGSVLGLATGMGAVGGVIKGVGAAKGAAKGIGGLTKVFDKIGQGAVNLVTGTTKDERNIIKGVKDEAKAAQHQIDLVSKLVRAGASPADARAKLGIAEASLTSFEGEPIQAGFASYLKNPVVLIGGAVGLFVLAKMFKIIK
jgi:hypothetical protein